MNQQEYLRVLSLIEEFRAQPSVSKSILKQAIPQSNCSQNALFGADLSLCVEYLRVRNLIPVCDSSAKQVTQSQFPCTHPEFLEVFDRVIFTDMEVLAKLAHDDPSIVWITWGSQFGVFAHKYLEETIFNDGQIYGIVGASALNGGYGGLVLYEINESHWSYSNFGRKIAKFDYGEKPVI